jgi:tRNA-(ms[2]io[6]A)-hydroxylase
LRRLVAKSEPQREIDLMMCGAFIEARSCERFARWRPAHRRSLGRLFQGLHNAEARHFRVYLDLARRAAGRGWTRPWRRGLRSSRGAHRRPPGSHSGALEAELITSLDEEFRFHSGFDVPATKRHSVKLFQGDRGAGLLR